eukprot:5601144-Pyramimonas_sp.AAC.1
MGAVGRQLPAHAPEHRKIDTVFNTDPTIVPACTRPVLQGNRSLHTQIQGIRETRALSIKHHRGLLHLVGERGSEPRSKGVAATAAIGPFTVAQRRRGARESSLTPAQRSKSESHHSAGPGTKTSTC